MTLPHEKQSVNYVYLASPIILGLLGGIIGYFILKKNNQRYAKYVLLIGFVVSIMWTIGIINLGVSTESKPDSELDYLTEANKIEKNNESIKQIDKQFPNADMQIQGSKKQIESSKKYQLDTWSLLFMFRQDLTKEQILQEEISQLENIIDGNYEELEYLKEDLRSAKTNFEEISIESQIKYYESTINYDQEKLSMLQNNGINALEKLEQNEIQENIEKHLERIQRLENLKSKNLDYLNTENDIFQYVSNYKGKDNKGNTLQIEVESFIKEKYGYDALTDNNPFLKDNWVKTSTIFYFGTEAIDEFTVMQDRYKVVRYAYFYQLQGEYKTILGFDFDTETYDIVADNQDSIDVLNKLNNN